MKTNKTVAERSRRRGKQLSAYISLNLHNRLRWWELKSGESASSTTQVAIDTHLDGRGVPSIVSDEDLEELSGDGGASNQAAALTPTTTGSFETT